jgi:uncharacterized protein (DUF2147 family)
MKRAASLIALSAGFAMLLALPAPCFAAAEDAIGTWQDIETGAMTQIYSCCGGVCIKVVTPSKGREVDGQNPDPALKGRSMAGVTIMTGAVKDGAERWKGQLYNSEDGKTYTGYIEVKSKDEVKLEGCVLAILCKTRVWRRAR